MNLRIVAIFSDGRNEFVDDLLEEFFLLLQVPDCLEVLVAVVLELLLDVADLRRQRLHLKMKQKLDHFFIF